MKNEPVLLRPRSVVQIVSVEEWQRVRNAKYEHLDVAEAVRMITDGKAVRVKFECPEGMQHKKRESARQMADRKGVHITTVYAEGFIYLARVPRPEASE